MDVQVAVVVVSYNTRELLLECLASVVESAQDTSYQLVVVDNASRDGSYEGVRDAYPQATIIRNAINRGFGAACNQGIEATRSRFVLLLNSDARLTAPALRVMSDCLEQNERCAAAGCRLIDADGAELVNTRNFLTPLNQALELAGITVGVRRLRRTPPPSLERNDCSVDWIDGACLMLRRDALEQAGLFDERFFMYSEDEDLCLRLRKHGWLVCFCGAATAVHHRSASSRLNKTEMLRQFYLSQMLFLSKHRGQRSSLFYRVFTRTAFILKQWAPGDAVRRETAREQLKALGEATQLARSDRL